MHWKIPCSFLLSDVSSNVVYSSSIYSAFVILDIFLLEHKGVVMGEVGKAVNLPLPL